jgi:hypothetical protein
MRAQKFRRSQPAKSFVLPDLSLYFTGTSRPFKALRPFLPSIAIRPTSA